MERETSIREHMEKQICEIQMNAVLAGSALKQSGLLIGTELAEEKTCNSSYLPKLILLERKAHRLDAGLGLCWHKGGITFMTEPRREISLQSKWNPPTNPEFQEGCEMGFGVGDWVGTDKADCKEAYCEGSGGRSELFLAERDTP